MTDSYTDFLKQDFQELFDSMGLPSHQEHFMRSRWLDQVLWMEKKAGTCQDRHQGLRLTTIILGVIVPILVGLDVGNRPDLQMAIRFVTVAFSGIVAVSAAVEEFFHYGERWTHYRRTVESLKRQGWQFSQLSGLYREYDSCQEAFPRFVDCVEDILQQEVEGYVTQIVQPPQEDEQSS
ncbi:MAG: DUF4231 domain-containing protein [Merismopedia sp. SIO2A8]|nr:DUF4231 domain-containing protein [Merismopedia sp. SIO2A8]